MRRRRETPEEAAIRDRSEADKDGPADPGAPRLAAPPALAGTGELGAEIAADPGRWSGRPRLGFQWRRDGAAIPGAVARVYAPGPEDDGRALDCAITAANAAGAATAIAGPIRARRRPPAAIAALPEEVFDQAPGAERIETAWAFSGDGLGFAAAGPPGVAIDPASGALAIPTDRPVSGAAVTVTAANSGGAASARLRYAVEAAIAEGTEAPPPLGPGAVDFGPSVWSPAGQAATFSPRLRFPGLEGAAVAAIEWTRARDPVPAAQWGPVRADPDAPGLYLAFAPGPLGAGAAEPAPFRADDGGDWLRFRWRALEDDAPSAPGAAYPVPRPAAATLPPPTRQMVRAAMLNNGKLRRFNDYDFLAYSQKAEGPHQSTAVRSKKQAHLSTIVALAAWAGDARRYGGVDPAARAAETLVFWARNQVPAARGGVGAQSDLMFANCAALGRATPAVWEAVGAEERARIDRAMEGLLVSAAWQNSDANPWVRAGDPRAERTITGGDHSRNRVPNFTSSSALMPYLVAAYMGTAEAEAFLEGFDRAAFAAAIRAANPDGALDDLEATFARDWTDGPNGPGPTAGELTAALRGGPDGGGYRQFGLGLGAPTAAVAREIERMWGRPIVAGLDPGAVRRVPLGVEKRPGEIGVFEHARFEGTPNRAPGRDAQVGRLTDLSAWPLHAYAGLRGMATELDTRDGGAAGSGGGPRASMSYAAEGCSILLTACAVLAALDRIDRADPGLADALARQGRGVYDMRFRSIHGHRSFAKGGRLWAGYGTNSDWDAAEAASFQMFELFDVWDLQLAPWAAG